MHCPFVRLVKGGQAVQLVGVVQQLTQFGEQGTHFLSLVLHTVPLGQLTHWLSTGILGWLQLVQFEAVP